MNKVVKTENELAQDKLKLAEKYKRILNRKSADLH